MNPERRYNVLKYEISFTPDFENKSIRGSNTITYLDSGNAVIQIDLQLPLEIDSIIQDNHLLTFKREGNAFHVETPDKDRAKKNCLVCQRKITVFIMVTHRSR